MSDEVKLVFDQVTAGLDETVRVTVRGVGAYEVPRLFIACHRFAGADLPELAERYGFQPA
jgi:hypothetical protein